MNITGIILRNRACYPKRTALLYNDCRLSWDALADRIERTAGGLASAGLRRGDRIALLADNSNRYIELLFAAPWIGAIAVPLNHRLSDAELAAILDDCGAVALVADSASFARASQISAAAAKPPVLIWADQGAGPAGISSCEDMATKAEPAQQVVATDADIIGIFYTGGTTGKPKGVMLTHGNMWTSSFSYCTVMQLSPDTVSLCSSPLFHVAAISAAMPALLAGGAVAVLPRFDPAWVMDAISDCGVTVANFVPAMIRMLLDQPEPLRDKMRSLKTLIYGAAPAPPALLDELQEAFPDLKVCHAYGMTELTGCISVLPSHYNTIERRGEGRWRSAGHAMPGAEVRIVDAGGKPAGAGVIGEICARGAVVMAGYWNQPRATAEALRDGWMHTGDAGYLDEEGFIYIVDRFKDMIISGGENVYSAEVEAVLARIAGVHQCAVFGIPDPRWGETVHAVIVPKPWAELNEADVIRHCRESLGGYKVPRSLEFRREPLPLSGVNKVLKRALRDEYLARRSSVS
jgi:long-chain acyl-CoA synthetase